jgi:hypothetical protein
VRTILSEQEESQIENYLLDCAAMGHPKSKEEIKLIAAEIASMNKIRTKNFKNSKPSKNF